MQAVTMYKANDGSLWKNETEAIERDTVDALVALAMKILPDAVEWSSAFEI